MCGGLSRNAIGADGWLGRFLDEACPAVAPHSDLGLSEGRHCAEVRRGVGGYGPTEMIVGEGTGDAKC